MSITQERLPAPTDDLDRAEHDLREHGICAVTGVLEGETLATVRTQLYDAAAQDRDRAGGGALPPLGHHPRL